MLYFLLSARRRALRAATIFALTLLAASGRTLAAPLVLTATGTAAPGDIVSLQGDSFGNSPTVSLAAPSLPAPLALPLISKSGNGILVQVPKSAPVDVYTLTVTDGIQVSPPVYVNRANAMHFDTPEVAASAPFRIFGRSLTLAGQTPTVRFVGRASGLSLTAAVDTPHSNAFVLSASAPAGLTPGETYDVYVANGGGGAAGETRAAEPLLGRASGTDFWNLQVGWAADYNFYGNVFDVTTDPRLTLHAAGNGAHDDGPAIQAAITRASVSVDPNTGLVGGVVYLPPGTYKLARAGLQMASHVVLAGAGAGVSTLQYGWAGTPNGAYGTFWGPGVTTAGLADLSLVNVNGSGTFAFNCVNKAGTSELFLQRIQWNLAQGGPIYWTNLPKMTIENSSFLVGAGFPSGTSYYRTGPLSLDGASNFILRGNTVVYAAGAYGMNYGAHDGVIENNHFTRDVSSEYPAGGAPAAIAGRQLAINFATNLAILGNTFDVTGGAMLANNDGESLLTEGGGGVRPDEDAGTVSFASASTLSDTTKVWTKSGVSVFTGSAIVALVSGPGAGQWRAVTGAAADSSGLPDTLTIDRPWNIVPTSATHYATFDWSAANWLVMGNAMTGNQRGIWLYSAACRDVAIVGNTLVNSGSILLRADQRMLATPIRMDILRNIQVQDNTVASTDAAHAAIIMLTYAQVSAAETQGMGFEGVDVRGNTISAQVPNVKDQQGFTDGFYANVLYQYNLRFTDTQAPALQNVVFQNNAATNCANAFTLSAGAYQTVLWDTSLTNCRSLIADMSIFGATHASTGTIIGSAPLVTAAASAAQITLSWEAVPGASGYHVYRAASAGGPYTSPLATVTGTTFTDTGAGPDTTYYYIVRAVYPGTAALEGLPSAEASAILAVPVTGLTFASASVIGGTVAQGTITLARPAPAAGTIVTLTGDNAAAPVPAAVTVPGGASSLTFPITTHQPTAIITETISATSGGAGASTLLTVNPLPAPAVLTALAADGLVTLSWSASPGAVSYNVYRSTVAGAEGSTPYQMGISALSLADTAVTDGTTYYYQVTAVAAGTESLRSPEASATPQPPAPAAPANLAAAPGDGQISLTWDAAPGATAYTLYRAAASGGPYSAVTSGLMAAAYTDAGLANGTTYYYVVTATNGGGESGFSSETSAAPQAMVVAPLAPPANLTATAGDSQIALAWTAGAGDAAFIVERGLTAGGPYTVVASGLVGTAYADTGLANGTPYYYVVVGLGAGPPAASRPKGNRQMPRSALPQSLPSNEANATPQPATVTISGTIGLQGPDALHQNEPLTYKLRPVTGSEMGGTLTPNPDGTFTLSAVPAGTYTLLVKGAKWLQSAAAVDASAGDVSGVSLTLPGGDLNGDNTVTAADLALIRAAFRTHSTSPNWNPNADINGDGVVNVSDYSIAASNFRKHGSD